MEVLPMTFAAGWASGINAYATVLVLGLLGRFLGVDSVPAGLQRTDVLIIMGVLAVIEMGLIIKYVKRGAEPFEEPPNVPLGGHDDDRPMAFAY